VNVNVGVQVNSQTVRPGYLIDARGGERDKPFIRVMSACGGQLLRLTAENLARVEQGGQPYEVVQLDRAPMLISGEADKSNEANSPERDASHAHEALSGNFRPERPSADSVLLLRDHQARVAREDAQADAERRRNEARYQAIERESPSWEGSHPAIP
jgi:hypothetical protein